jgi:hypothetical protein
MIHVGLRNSQQLDVNYIITYDRHFKIMFFFKLFFIDKQRLYFKCDIEIK